MARELIKGINPKLKIKFTAEEAEYVLHLLKHEQYRTLDEYLVMEHGYDCDEFDKARIDALIALEAHGAYVPETDEYDEEEVSNDD